MSAGGIWEDCPRCEGRGSLPSSPLFGAWFRAERTALGLLQSDVAGKIGVTQAHLSDLERGARGWTPQRARLAVDLFRELKENRAHLNRDIAEARKHLEGTQ